MPIADLLLPEVDSEIAITRSVLERVPDDGDKGAWKPHEKSFPLAHLAQLVARLPGWVAMVTEQEGIDIAPGDGPNIRADVRPERRLPPTTSQILSTAFTSARFEYSPTLTQPTKASRPSTRR